MPAQYKCETGIFYWVQAVPPGNAGDLEHLMSTHSGGKWNHGGAFEQAVVMISMHAWARVRVA